MKKRLSYHVLWFLVNCWSLYGLALAGHAFVEWIASSPLLLNIFGILAVIIIYLYVEKELRS